MQPRESQRTAEEIFGREIKSRRERLGLSQEELGFRTGLHRTYISQIERGLKSPTLGVILKLARVIGRSAGQLMATVERQIR